LGNTRIAHPDADNPAGATDGPGRGADRPSPSGPGPVQPGGPRRGRTRCCTGPPAPEELAVRCSTRKPCVPGSLVSRRLTRVYFLKQGRIKSASRASFPPPLSLAPEVPHAVGLPVPPPGYRDVDRRFYRPKSRSPNRRVFQPKVHRTPVLVF